MNGNEQVDKADLIGFSQGPTLAELNANDESPLSDLNFDDFLLPSQHGQHGAHGHDAHDEGSALSEDELDLLRGALSLNEKHVESVMKPLSRVYSLMPDAVLDERTMGKIVASGFSRVPIRMAGGADTIAKYLIVKEQLMLSPAERKPATSVLLHAPVWVGPGSSLLLHSRFVVSDQNLPSTRAQRLGATAHAPQEELLQSAKCRACRVPACRSRPSAHSQAHPRATHRASLCTGLR